jgi:alpha-glucosidase
LIELRKQEPALIEGSYQPLRCRDDVLMFKRCCADSELLVALNFSLDPRNLPVKAPAMLLMSSCLDRAPAPLGSEPVLRAAEGLILQLSDPAAAA